MTNFRYFLDAFVLLMVVMNPAAIAALYITMSSRHSVGERLQMARTGCWVALGLLAFFAFAGEDILRILGITLASFRIAGGMLLLMIGFGMLRSDDSDDISDGDIAALKAKRRPDLAITPLAVPMIAGPGAISSTILKVSESHSILQWILFFVALLSAVAIVYFILDLASRSAKFLGKTMMKLFFRLSGLILIALAVQFILVGFEQTDLFAQIMSR